MWQDRMTIMENESQMNFEENETINNKNDIQKPLFVPPILENVESALHVDIPKIYEFCLHFVLLLFCLFFFVFLFFFVLID